MDAINSDNRRLSVPLIAFQGVLWGIVTAFAYFRIVRSFPATFSYGDPYPFFLAHGISQFIAFYLLLRVFVQDRRNVMFLNGLFIFSISNIMIVTLLVDNLRFSFTGLLLFAKDVVAYGLLSGLLFSYLEHRRIAFNPVSAIACFLFYAYNLALPDYVYVGFLFLRQNEIAICALFCLGLVLWGNKSENRNHVRNRRQSPEDRSEGSKIFVLSTAIQCVLIGVAAIRGIFLVARIRSVPYYDPVESPLPLVLFNGVCLVLSMYLLLRVFVQGARNIAVLNWLLVIATTGIVIVGCAFYNLEYSSFESLLFVGDISCNCMVMVLMLPYLAKCQAVFTPSSAIACFLFLLWNFGLYEIESPNVGFLRSWQFDICVIFALLFLLHHRRSDGT